MKILKVKKGFLKQTIKIPSSKSYANRVLILASLHSQPFTIHRISFSSDVLNLIKALKEIGLRIEESGDSITIINSFPASETLPKIISVGEGGTTARFLAALLTLGSLPYVLILGERLKNRPWQEFIDFVNKFGGKASLVDNRLMIQGPLDLPEEVRIDCTRTGQFASGVQLAYAFTHLKIIPENLKSSPSYWKMTENLVKDLRFSTEFDTPLDWSSASYPLAFGALHQTINLPGLHYDKYQSDAKFYELLKKMGAIHDSSNGINVSPHKNAFSVKIDVSDCLDLVPTLAYFLSHVEGTHELTGIGNLVYKESDRLAEIIKLLNLFEKEAQVCDQKLIIKGNKTILERPMDLILPEDHRMVMTATLFLLHHSGGSITNSDSVNKSFPQFFRILN